MSISYNQNFLDHNKSIVNTANFQKYYNIALGLSSIASDHISFYEEEKDIKMFLKNVFEARLFAAKCCAVIDISNKLWPGHALSEKDVLDCVSNLEQSTGQGLVHNILESIYNLIDSYNYIENDVTDAEEGIMAIGDDALTSKELF